MLRGDGVWILTHPLLVAIEYSPFYNNQKITKEYRELLLAF